LFVDVLVAVVVFLNSLIVLRRRRFLMNRRIRKDQDEKDQEN